jgi:SulP family sulfate permease
LPVSGSLTRSSFNYESGAVTQVASLITGLLCLLVVFFLGGAVAFIPKCSLAILIMAVSVGLFHRRHLTICWRATRGDSVTLLVTLLATLLLPLHVAIFLGVATSVVLYLRQAARPMLVEYTFSPEGNLLEKAASIPRTFPQISIVHVEGELFFGAAELFRTQIQRTVADPNLRVIILRMKNARHLDATSVMALEDLISFLRSKQRHLIISGAMKGVYRVLKDSKMIDVIGRENFFLGSPQNPNLSTRNALKRAQELLGTKEAEVKIWYDPSQEK